MHPPPPSPPSSPFSSSPASLTSMETASKDPQQRSRRNRLDLIHLDVPLISTRRSSAAAACSPELHRADTSRRVPFLWERAPGVPKDGARRPSSSRKEEDFFFFPPKPPPGRRRRHLLLAVSNGEDDGNDGDVDSCSDGDSNGECLFCEAVDKVSFPHSPALDSSDSRGLHRPPSFIMNRFLRAANALAASSTPAMQTTPKRQTHRPPSTTPPHCLRGELLKSRQQQTTTWSAATNVIKIQPPHRPLLPSRPRGFQVFFPWTLKQTPCGHKSPVMCQTPTSAGVEAFGKKSRKISFDHLTRVKEKADDDLSSKAFKSPGWGMPFLEASRLGPRGRDDEKGRGREFVTGTRGGGKPTWNLPRLQKPSEPWLLRALNNANRRY